MHKVTNRFCSAAVLMSVFILGALETPAQDTVLNKHGLWVIKEPAVFFLSLKNRAEKQMTDLKKSIPGIVIDLRYAGTNNFMKKKLYSGAKTAYLRSKAAKALSLVQAELSKQGLGLKILDAYRPYSVTEAMWELVKDDRYTADPKKGSGHNRGAAVDLTIISLETKKELDMGTGFDNFSDTAHHDFTALPEQVLKNRLLLKNTMEQSGFKSLETEWWHYSIPDAREFELLDIGFKEMRRIAGKK